MKNLKKLAILLASILTFAIANAESKPTTNKKETVKTTVESGKKAEKATPSQTIKELFLKTLKKQRKNPKKRVKFR